MIKKLLTMIALLSTGLTTVVSAHHLESEYTVVTESSSNPHIVGLALLSVLVVCLLISYKKSSK